MCQWWKEAVVYQIYPRSFYDANGDGIGDLAGVTSKLDYLQRLGIDAIWLSPICHSPNRDNGYDIEDYCAINPEFGTLDEFDRLVAAAHGKGIRIIFDMVCNHTSDRHPWFVEASASKDNPKRDFYIWRSGRDGQEPNNWQADFGGSAWTHNQATGDYYLGVFSPYQPDLNWENPEVRQKMYEVIRWWAARGVDGFRLDVINFLCKAPGLPDVQPPADAPAEKRYFPAGEFYVDQPGIHPLLQEMRREAFLPAGVATVGECHGRRLTPERDTGGRYLHNELDMMFHFDIPWFFRHNMAALGFKRIYEWRLAVGQDGWTTITLNNHDMPRQVSSIGDDTNFRVESAKAISMLLLTAPGTPFLYQGEELGMTNVAFDTIEQYRDISTLNKYNQLLREGKTPAEALASIQPQSRDNGRTPLHWNSSPNAGFTRGNPWIALNPNYQEINVAAQDDDPDSVLNWYRQLIALRKEHPTLVYGDYELRPLGDAVYAYCRTRGEETLTVILNWCSTPGEALLPEDLSGKCRRALLANYSAPCLRDNRMPLRPWEAVLYKS